MAKIGHRLPRFHVWHLLVAVLMHSSLTLEMTMISLAPNRNNTNELLETGSSSRFRLQGQTSMDNLQSSAESKKPVDSTQEHLSSAVIKDFFDRNFDKVNGNGDKYVDAAELTAAIRYGNVTGPDARIAEAIIPNLHALELLSNDEWGTENNGITRRDVLAFEKNRREDPKNDLAKKLESSMNSNEHNRDKFIEIMDIYKTKFDDDKSKGISRPELEDYIKQSKDGAVPVAVARFLLDHFDAINEFGSKSSTGSYKGVLHGDGNSRAISFGELAALSDVIGPASHFRNKLWDIHGGNDEIGSELGKRARSSVRAEDGAAAILASFAVEVIGATISASSKSRMESLLQDYEHRKEMLESWKFFDR